MTGRRGGNPRSTDPRFWPLAAMVGAGLVLAGCGQGQPDTSSTDPVEGTTSVQIGGDLDAPQQADGDDTRSSTLVAGTEDEGAPPTSEPPGPAETPAPTALQASTTTPGSGGDGGGDGPTESTKPPSTFDPSSDDPELEDDPAIRDRADVDTPGDALTDLASGATTSLDQELGQGLTLLWFWAPTSSTSEREAAVAQRFANAFDGSVQVIAVGVGDDRAAADSFVDAVELSVPTLWATGPEVGDSYGVTTYPTAVLIDRSDTIVARWPGLSEEAFRFVERIS